MWDEFKNIPNGNRTGLYIIARFNKRPEGIANPLAQEILYIGETHGAKQNIHSRLNTFFRAAQIGKGKVSHSGGNRFNRELGGNLKNIYVAGFVPPIDGKQYMTPYICYAERKLIWEYVLKWGNIPRCNGY